jgi:hypothetical protein
MLGWVETSTPGATSILITKFNTLGIPLWSRTARVNTDLAARGGIAADGAGNIYVTSQFSGTAFFGVTNVISQGASDAFVASYDTSGAVRWVKQAGGGTTEEGRAIAVDPFGNCYFTGWFTGNAPFGGATLTNSGAQDIFIAKLEARPALNISRFDGHVLLSWPIAAAGFQLESTGQVPAAGSWSAVTNPPGTANNQRVVTNAVTGNKRFYRLSKP